MCVYICIYICLRMSVKCMWKHVHIERISSSLSSMVRLLLKNYRKIRSTRHLFNCQVTSDTLLNNFSFRYSVTYKLDKWWCCSSKNMSQVELFPQQTHLIEREATENHKLLLICPIICNLWKFVQNCGIEWIFKPNKNLLMMRSYRFQLLKSHINSNWMAVYKPRMNMNGKIIVV